MSRRWRWWDEFELAEEEDSISSEEEKEEPEEFALHDHCHAFQAYIEKELAHVPLRVHIKSVCDECLQATEQFCVNKGFHIDSTQNTQPTMKPFFALQTFTVWDIFSPPSI